MDGSNSEKKTFVQKLMSPWVLVISSVLLLGGSGTLSALIAAGIIRW